MEKGAELLINTTEATTCRGEPTSTASHSPFKDNPGNLVQSALGYTHPPG